AGGRGACRGPRDLAGLAGRRWAGVRSFGPGGTVTHGVLAEHEAGPVPPAPARPHLLVLSAYDEDRLCGLAGRVAEHLRRNAVDLADVAYTLQVGREPLRERLAVVVGDTAEAAGALERFAAGQG